METIIIRNATINDIKQIMDIEYESFCETVHEDRSVFIDRILTFPDGFLVLEINGYVSGYISSEIWTYSEEIREEMFNLNHSIRKVHNATSSELYISSIGILKEHRGEGYGNLLFTELFERITRRYKVSSIILIVSVMWTAAKRIYENNGFKEIYIIHDFFKEEINPDGIVMRKYI